MDPAEVEARYPRAGKYVGDLFVRDRVPNLSSIDGYFGESETLRGVRVVPLSDFSGPPRFYPADVKRLAEAILESGELNPLIVGVDAEGPFIIEGAHRFDALWYLKKREFPAIVVVDTETEMPRKNPVSSGLDSNTIFMMGIGTALLGAIAIAIYEISQVGQQIGQAAQAAQSVGGQISEASQSAQDVGSQIGYATQTAQQLPGRLPSWIYDL